MRNLALVVPRERGEEIRLQLVRDGRLKGDLEILRNGPEIAFPIVEAPPDPGRFGRLEQLDFEPRKPPAPLSYRDLLDWPQADRELLPRSFDVVGDIVLLRLPPELRLRAREIGEALIRFVPGTRLAGADEGVHGPERRRTLRRLAGTGTWKTRHRENGLEFEIDLERAYFSPRLAREHARVAALVRKGDRVLDACAGVGPFSLLIAREGRALEVVAVDMNPDAIKLLQLTQGRLELSTPLRSVCARLEEFLPSTSRFDRVIFNLPHEGIKYLPSVAATVARGGVIHYYEVTPRAEFQRRPEELMATVGAQNGWSISEFHTVHPYSPSSDLVSYDLALREE